MKAEPHGGKRQACPRLPGQPERLDHEMKMIAHETERMNVPAGFHATLGQGSQKTLPICVVAVNRLAMIPAIHDVVDRTGIFHSELASLAPSCSHTEKSVNTID